MGARFQLCVPAKNVLPINILTDYREIQVAYGLGTANGKRGGKDFDESIVNVTIKALNAGFTHLDCAEGMLAILPPFPNSSLKLTANLDGKL